MNDSDRPVNGKACGEQCGCSEMAGADKPKRRRGLTSVTLQWLAEKFRRAQDIKAQLAEGTYEVDSQKVAKAIITGDKER